MNFNYYSNEVGRNLQVKDNKMHGRALKGQSLIALTVIKETKQK